MRRIRRNLLVLMTTVTTSAAAAPAIHFEVSFKEPQAHYAEVKMEISDLRKDYIDVKMPVWTPGSYLVREYSRHVESVEACDADGALLAVEKIDKNTWRIQSDKAKKVTFSYRIYGFEVSVRTNFIDDSHAFLSPAEIGRASCRERVSLSVMGSAMSSNHQVGRA